jgi:CRISPR-associated protein Cas8a1/Csx13
MTSLHRLGLGALYRTLLSMQREGLLRESDWEHDRTSVTLKGDLLVLLRRVYDYGFQIREGVIYLPGAYGRAVRKEVLIALHKGILATILRSNQSHGPLKKDQVFDYDYEDSERISHRLSTRYSGLESFGNHESSIVASLFNRKGYFKESVACPSTVAPGYKKRHVKVAGTDVLQSARFMVPLHFVLAGVMTLGYRQQDDKTGKWTNCSVLYYPEVQDLEQYDRHRPVMNPTDITECTIKGGADVAILTQLRLLKQFRDLCEVDRFVVMEYGSAGWDPQQPVRSSVSIYDLGKLDSESIRLLNTIAATFAPRVAQKDDRHFVVDNNIRPFLLRNVMAGKEWHRGFGDFVSSREVFLQISYEKKGLNKMVKSMPDGADKGLIQALHYAMRAKFAEIHENASPGEVQEKKRKAREKWYYDILRARRMEDVRSFICELVARALPNRQMSQQWEQVIPLFRDPANWSYLRDLAILAISTDPPYRQYQCVSCEKTGFYSEFRSDTGQLLCSCGSTERPRILEDEASPSESEEFEESLQTVED